jgi:hypothetical protein
MVWELDAFLCVLDSAEEDAAECPISISEWRRLGPLLYDWLYRAN